MSGNSPFPTAQDVGDGLKMYAEIFKHIFQSAAKGMKSGAGKVMDGCNNLASKGGKLMAPDAPTPNAKKQNKGPLEGSVGHKKQLEMSAQNSGPAIGSHDFKNKAEIAALVNKSFEKYGVSAEQTTLNQTDITGMGASVQTSSPMAGTNQEQSRSR